MHLTAATFAGPSRPAASSRHRAHRSRRAAKPSSTIVRAVAAESLTRVAPEQEWPDGNRLAFVKPEGITRQTAPPGACPVVVCPGFGNNSADYVAPFGDPNNSLAASLKARGWDVTVVDMERKDWAKILGGLLSLGFWTQKSTSDPAYTWYIERLDAAVHSALASNPGATQVDLVCHSAGGWLARAYLGGASERSRMEQRSSTTQGKRQDGNGRPDPAPHAAPVREADRDARVPAPRAAAWRQRRHAGGVAMGQRTMARRVLRTRRRPVSLRDWADGAWGGWP